MQLHVMNDKHLYCDRSRHGDKDLCDANDPLGLVAPGVSAGALASMAAQGLRREAGLSPPISFRIAGGRFMILGADATQDRYGQKTVFGTARPCARKLADLAVGATWTCLDSGKRLSKWYEERLGSGLIAAHQDLRFRVYVRWPTVGDDRRRLRVELWRGDRHQVLVDDSRLPFGSLDNQFPFFKAGIYRQNGNAVPMSVVVKQVLRLREPKVFGIQDLLTWDEGARSPALRTRQALFVHADPADRRLHLFRYRPQGGAPVYPPLPSQGADIPPWTHVGVLADWSADGRGRVGDLHVYDNPYTGSVDLLQLQALDSAGRYGSYPIGVRGNAYWFHLGSWRRSGQSPLVVAPELDALHVTDGPVGAGSRLFRLLRLDAQGRVSALPPGVEGDAAWRFVGRL